MDCLSRKNCENIGLQLRNRKKSSKNILNSSLFVCWEKLYANSGRLKKFREKIFFGVWDSIFHFLARKKLIKNGAKSWRTATMVEVGLFFEVGKNRKISPWKSQKLNLVFFFLPRNLFGLSKNKGGEKKSKALFVFSNELLPI